MDNNNNERNLCLETFFNEPAQNPFTYNLNLKEELFQNHGLLFEEIKKIFVNGLLFNTKKENILINGESKTVMIDKIEEKDILSVKNYMLSIGIDVTYKQYDLEDKDYYIRTLLYELEKIKEVKIDTIVDWRKQLVKSVHINIDKKVVDEAFKIIKKHPIANAFLGLYKPEKLNDFNISYTKPHKPDILNIINFKGANMTDYHYNNKYTMSDPFNKHVR